VRIFKHRYQNDDFVIIFRTQVKTTAYVIFATFKMN